ncbi:MAG: ISL3 family transposase [Erysipelotrichaceae bacterium]|nr:ISL3 family transposase [Erysipelotrichaceae bacterium]
MLNHEQLFTAALQITEPLYVESVEFKPIEGELHIYLNFRKGAKFQCPICGKDHLSVHDTKEKTWRHLNFFQYKAFIHFRTPRVNCPDHGIHLMSVPWAHPSSGFTLLFEAFVMQLATAMASARIAQVVGEHDTLIWRIIKRYVDSARAEADYSQIKSIGIDETSSKKRHNYVTLFVDMHESRVVHVSEGKDSTTLQSFKSLLVDRKISPLQIEKISADMSPAFQKGVTDHFEWAQVTFDKFHVIKMMNEALDNVRREEYRQEDVLKHSRYLWLRNPTNLTTNQAQKLENLNKLNLKTARAYRIKLALQDVYANATDKVSAMLLLNDWYKWASHSRLKPITEFAKTIKKNWAGILNYFDSKLTNGILESINSIVQAARNRARGFRNVETFITMIFLLGGKLKLEIQQV